MKRKLLIIGAFLAVFALGAVAGGFAVFGLGRKALDRRAADLTAQHQWRRLADDLKLDEAQRKEARALVLRTVRERVQAQRLQHQAQQRLERDIEKLLTPEQALQFKEWRRLNLEQDREWQRWLREQRKTLKEPPPRPPGSERKGKRPDDDENEPRR